MHATFKDHERDASMADEGEDIRRQLTPMVDLCMTALLKALLVAVVTTPGQTAMWVTLTLGLNGIVLRVAETLLLDRLQVVRQRGKIYQLALFGMPDADNRASSNN